MMRTWRRFWLRRRTARHFSHTPRPGTGGVSLLIASALGICLAVLLIRSFDGRVRPILSAMAEAKVQNAVSGLINEIVEQTLAEDAIAYQDIISLEKDNTGQITALTSDSAEMNRLRTEILQTIITQVDKLNSNELGIPLGNLTGLTSLAEKGPVLPVRVNAVGSAQAAFQNQFTSAGINQTYHQVMLDITVDLALLIPGETVDTSVHTQLCVAETVLVGEVPQTYLQLTPVQ